MIEAVMIKGKPNEKEKKCFDCIHCKASVSRWCTNEKAIKDRKTSIPGICNCKYWKPVLIKEQLSWWERLFKDYIPIEE